MIRSMTGYGKAEQIFKTNNISVEIKTLNSKQLDLIVKLPQELKANEFEYRNEIAARLQRGKVDVMMTITNTDVAQNTHIESWHRISNRLTAYRKNITSLSRKTWRR